MSNPKLIDQVKSLQEKLGIIETDGVVGIEQLNSLKREVANLKLHQDTADRIPAGTVFGSNFTETFGMTIDFAKARIGTNVPAGSGTVSVNDASEFLAGQEVTIFDDVNLERVTITSVMNNTISITPTERTYKTGARIARSTIGKDGSFGKWDENGKGLTESDIRIKFHQATQEVAAYIQHDPDITISGQLKDQEMQSKYREIKSYEMATVTTEFVGYETSYG